MGFRISPAHHSTETHMFVKLRKSVSSESRVIYRMEPPSTPAITATLTLTHEPQNKSFRAENIRQQARFCTQQGSTLKTTVQLPQKSINASLQVFLQYFSCPPTCRCTRGAVAKRTLPHLGADQIDHTDHSHKIIYTFQIYIYS